MHSTPSWTRIIIRLDAHVVIKSSSGGRVLLTLALCALFVCLRNQNHISRLLLHNHHHQPSTALEMFVEITSPMTDKRNFHSPLEKSLFFSLQLCAHTLNRFIAMLLSIGFSAHLFTLTGECLWYLYELNELTSFLLSLVFCENLFKHKECLFYVSALWMNEILNCDNLICQTINLFIFSRL